MTLSSRVPLIAAAAVVAAGAILSPSAVANADPQAINWGQNAQGFEVWVTNNSDHDLYFDSAASSAFNRPYDAPPLIKAHSKDILVKGMKFEDHPGDLTFDYIYGHPDSSVARCDAQVNPHTHLINSDPMTVYSHGTNKLGCTFTKKVYSEQLQFEIHDDNSGPRA